MVLGEEAEGDSKFRMKHLFVGKKQKLPVGTDFPHGHVTSRNEKSVQEGASI